MDHPGLDPRDGHRRAPAVPAQPGPDERPRAPDPARAVRPGVIQPVAQDEPNEQLRALALVRGELLGTLPTLDVRFPEVAAQVRLADSQVYGALLQQAQALAALDQLSPQLPDHPGTAASRAEIRDRLAEGLAGYHHLLAETVLLLARSDAGLHSQDPLECARDLVATYSEGLRAAELLR